MAGSSAGGGVPPGFRFHPTDEELLHFYLKKKISFHKFDMEVIREVDLNKIEPWELQERCKIGSTPQNEWYFFSHKDRKYPTGSRTNRATSAGFWKATGRDKCIRNSFKKMGMRKTLVFYRGRAPHGQKTDWIMHEYRLEDSTDPVQSTHEDGWVICRVFKKKNLFKIGSSGGGGEHHQHHHHSSSNTHNNNMNNNGMMMMNADDVQVNMSTATSSRSGSAIFNTNMTMNHHHQYVQAADLNYSHHHIPTLPQHQHHQYGTQIEEAHNFISNHNTTLIKPTAAALMMLSSPSSTYDDHLSTTDYNNNNNNPSVMPPDMLQFMSSCNRDADQCESAASPTTAAGYQQVREDADENNLNEWNGLTANTTNQLSLRSTEMQDFWAYAK